MHASGQLQQITGKGPRPVLVVGLFFVRSMQIMQKGVLFAAAHLCDEAHRAGIRVRSDAGSGETARFAKECLMRLAEALAHRADCEARFHDLKKRIVRNICVQEGEQPGEDAQLLLDEVDRLALRLMELVQTINRTNAVTRFDEDTTLADAIAERDVLGCKRDLLTAVADAAGSRYNNSIHENRRLVAVVPVSKVQRQVDQLAKRYREIDNRIQEQNWKTDVV